MDPRTQLGNEGIVLWCDIVRVVAGFDWTVLLFSRNVLWCDTVLAAAGLDCACQDHLVLCVVWWLVVGVWVLGVVAWYVQSKSKREREGRGEYWN